MKYLFFFLPLVLFMNGQITYPETEKKPTSETYFGTTVNENYTWLEDDQSAETKKWVNNQNTVTQSYISTLPGRNALHAEITTLYDYEKSSMPFKRGEYLYYYKNDGLQKHSVLYRSKNGNEAEEVFLDPNTFSKDGSTSLSSIHFSPDYSLLAYQISVGGSDWRKVMVIDTKTKKLIEKSSTNIKFSNIAWKGNNGYFYSKYDTPDGSLLSAKTHSHKLYYHELHNIDDKLIFGDDNNPKRYVGAYTSKDQNYLYISASNNTSGNELHFINLKRGLDIATIQKDQDSDVSAFYNDGKIHYFFTNYNAPNNRLVKANEADINDKSKWADVIPEEQFVLNLSKAGDKFFASYMIDANDEVVVYSKDGERLYQIDMPKGSVNGFSAEKGEKFTYFAFENYISPATIYKYDIENNSYEEYSKSKINFNATKYITEQHFYTSFDGTKVPITISYHKNTPLNGTAPTILYGYGGFNVSLQPRFSIFAATWMKNGGIYAVPNLRGGGEYGKEWHKAGTQLQKKNVFNDFISAGNFLKTNHYTSTQNLAISGGSNGGLLVGAVMTMQPDFAAVAIPAVGVLDMLKYHTFTSGAGWAYDYGTAEDSKEMFDFLRSYSPVHNVKQGTCYPATLVKTGDHDDRVVPAHSFKFAAELQEKQNCQKPVLIRIETQAGHGAGKSTDVIINEYADTIAFILGNVGDNAIPISEGVVPTFENNEIQKWAEEINTIGFKLKAAAENGNATSLTSEAENLTLLAQKLASFKKDKEFEKARNYFNKLRMYLSNL